MFCKAYVVRMQYNRKKDLLFVTKSSFGNLVEEVHEVDHLEIVPPDLKGESVYFGNFDTGYTSIYDLNKEEVLKVDNRADLWKDGKKDELYSKVTRLWDRSYFDEYRA